MRYTAAEVMEVNTCIVRDSATLKDVAIVLAHKGGQLVLMSSAEGRLTGIFTETDLARAFIKKTDPATVMTNLMTKSPVYVQPEDSLEQCAAMMSQHGFRHLPVYDGRRILGVVGILTIQRQLNERLEESLARLERRDEYLSVVAHDMRSPVSVVHSCCEMLKMVMADEKVSQQEVRELLNRITENADAALKLMNDLLDIRQLNQGIKLERQWTDITGFLQRIVDNQTVVSQRRSITISLAVQGDLQAYIDPKRYEEIMTNLLSNAVKFSPKGGVVTVKAWMDAGHFLNVSIADQGPGVPKEKVARVFRKHEQLESEFKKLGFGLGLSIALNFALLHEGSIHLDSELGRGCKFVVLTPQARVGYVSEGSDS